MALTVAVPRYDKEKKKKKKNTSLVDQCLWKELNEFACAHKLVRHLIQTEDPSAFACVTTNNNNKSFL